MSRLPFRFKRFSVSHSLASMPVGVDGVLIGAWATIGPHYHSILDVGTGCGLIALICAQRSENFPSPPSIIGIDVHAPSINEAAQNFQNSLWSDRLEAKLIAFETLQKTEQKFDLIISNPPFFDAGVHPDHTDARQCARHTDIFGPTQLLQIGAPLLSSIGRIAMITPTDSLETLKKEAEKVGLSLSKICYVRTTPRRQPKRILTEFTRTQEIPEITELTIQTGPEQYTSQYKDLTKEFYLKF